VRASGAFYFIGQFFEDEPRDSFRRRLGLSASGGYAYRVTFLDGHKICTRDLWYASVIPDRFSERLPDNATVFPLDAL
jgi:hypothetical protein